MRVLHPELRSNPNVITAPLKLTVAMAAHNEEATIARAVRAVLDLDLPFDLELIVVDDGSSDRSLELAREFVDERLIVLAHPQRRGKGAAVLSALAVASGTHFLVFDADLEYAPEDIELIMQPVLDGTADVIYGARIPGMRTSFPSARFHIGSWATTMFTNLVFDSWLHDMHTCLKLVPVPLMRSLSLSQTGFGLDTEITGELLRRGVRPYEIPCHYKGRALSAGKKISARDGVECLGVVLKVRLRGLVARDDAAVEVVVRTVPSAPPAIVAEADVAASPVAMLSERRSAAVADHEVDEPARAIIGGS